MLRLVYIDGWELCGIGEREKPLQAPLRRAFAATLSVALVANSRLSARCLVLFLRNCFVLFSKPDMRTSRSDAQFREVKKINSTGTSIVPLSRAAQNRTQQGSRVTEVALFALPFPSSALRKGRVRALASAFAIHVTAR